MRTKSQISKNCDTARTLQYIGGRTPTFHTLEANNGHEMAWMILVSIFISGQRSFQWVPPVDACGDAIDPK